MGFTGFQIILTYFENFKQNITPNYLKNRYNCEFVTFLMQMNLYSRINIGDKPQPSLDLGLVGCDIFSGAGGMSLGAEMAGINVKFAVENNAYAAQSFERNHEKSNVLVEDIRNVNPENHFSKSPFIVFGGPPCQGFSSSNTVTRNSKNKKNNLFEEFIRFIEILSPEWCIFENVEGFVLFQKGKVLEDLSARLQRLGYTTSPKVLVASDYGVPQERRRFFLVGNKSGKKYEFPKPHKKKFSVADAIFDLPILKNGDSIDELPYKSKPLSDFAFEMRRNSKKAIQNYVSRNQDYVVERYKHIKPGQNWKAIPDELMTNYKDKTKCHSGIYRRLNPDLPSVVIANYRKNMLIHPTQDRGLSVREAARLQSFPDDFEFQGPLVHIQQQIGNAVPPLLAKAIFEHLIKQAD